MTVLCSDISFNYVENFSLAPCPVLLLTCTSAAASGCLILKNFSTSIYLQQTKTFWQIDKHEINDISQLV